MSPGPAPVSSRDLTTPTPKLRRPASRRRRSLALSPLAPIPPGFGLRGRLLRRGIQAIRLIVLNPAQESCHCCCANAATDYAAADVPQRSVMNSRRRMGPRRHDSLQSCIGNLSDHRGSPENACRSADSRSSAARGSGPFWTAASASSNCCGVAIPTKIVPIAG
jgi:hypothetical protein